MRRLFALFRVQLLGLVDRLGVVVVAGVAVVGVGVTTGCSVDDFSTDSASQEKSPSLDGPNAPDRHRQDRPRRDRAAKVKPSPKKHHSGHGADSVLGSTDHKAWSCSWSPTMNNDWHDDMLCSDGVGEQRPYLLSNDSFVERYEIERAAAAWADSMND